MKFVHGIAFPDADDFMAAEVRPDGTYQAPHLSAALAWVRRRRLSLDGGAHVGLWSRVLSATFDRVIAIEPSPDTYAALVTNLQCWGCTNVTVRQVALASAEGFVDMTLDATQAARKNTGGRFAAPGQSVQCLPLDSLALTDLDFLKLDIEGSEYQALVGARMTLRTCRPVVLFEEKRLGERYFGTAKDAASRFLHDVRYRRVATIGCDQIWVPT